MLWFIFAFLTALFESLKDVSSKATLKNVDEYVVSWSLRFFALPFLLPFLLFIKIPRIGDMFWVALILGGGLNVVTTILYMKAIKHSDLSITVPMVAFTPLFLLITSPLILGEFPSIPGMLGIVLIVAGSYILNIKETHKGYMEPFKALIKEKGPKLMLGVAFIWSITSNIDKVGVQNSSPIFWAIAVNLFIAMILLPIMMYYSDNYKKQTEIHIKALIPIGLFSALTLIFQMTAINLTLVAYVIAIKRTSVIMTVFLGWLIFKEKGIKERAAGTLIMLLGVFIILLT